MKNQIEAIVKSTAGAVVDIGKLSKLEAIIADHRKLRDQFEDLVYTLLDESDEDHTDYPKGEKVCLDEIEMIIDTLF